MDSKPDINVTPLIDVLLVLLIIFMVISPTNPAHLETKAPSEPKDTKNAEPNPNTLLVRVNKDFTFKLNNEKSYQGVDDLTRLSEDLKTVFADRMENYGGTLESTPKTVFVKAPKGLDYGSVVKVIDAVRHSGAEPVGLQLDGLD